jgi:hypothetical protein
MISFLKNLFEKKNQLLSVDVLVATRVVVATDREYILLHPSKYFLVISVWSLHQLSLEAIWMVLSRSKVDGERFELSTTCV